MGMAWGTECSARRKSRNANHLAFSTVAKPNAAAFFSQNLPRLAMGMQVR
jgi:hypothetical protein